MKNLVRHKIHYIYLITALLSLVGFLTLAFLVREHRFYYIGIAVLGTVFFVSYPLYVFAVLNTAQRTSHQIQESIEYFATSLMFHLGIGVVILNDSNKPIWMSKMVSERFYPSSKAVTLSPGDANLLDLCLKSNKPNVNFTHDGLRYAARVFAEKKVIIIQDITAEHLINRYLEEERIVIGFADIDSYNQYQFTQDEETLFQIDSLVVKVWDKLTAQHGFVYKKYGGSKFIFITNNQTLRVFENCHFSFLNTFKRASQRLGVKLSLSLGFGTGSTSLNEIEANARSAISLSQSRGGDQITIVSSVAPTRYYGGGRPALPTHSLVQIRAIAEAFTKKVQSKKVRNVVVMGHTLIDLDAVGAALGVATIVQQAKKPVTIANNTTDATTKLAFDKWLPQDVNLFTRTNRCKRLISDKTLLVFVDVNSTTRLEDRSLLNKVPQENIFVFDHHRVASKNQIHALPTQTYIDTSASSACEIITEIINFIPVKCNVSKFVAQFMLAGIYMDTNFFQKSVSLRTYKASAWLSNFGAEPNQAVNILKPSEEESRVLTTVSQHAEEIKPGYFLAVYDKELTQAMTARCAETLLSTANRKAAFVIARVPNKKAYCMSARSVNVNVQIIAELVGGGGHYAAAAAVSSEPLAVFRDNIIQAIVSVKSNASDYR